MSDFADRVLELGISLNDQQLSQFETYFQMLVEWNEKMNLTAITERGEVYIKHFLDSVTLTRSGIFRGVEKLIDLGTGAGFPGIPLKIAFPEISITLADSLQKRIGFLEEVVKVLGLSDVTLVHGRAEDLGRDAAHRERYDLCVSRAVANLSTLSEYCLPFVKVGGHFVSYKSVKGKEEGVMASHALEILGGDSPSWVEFVLPGTDLERCLAVICKIKNTPKGYPRKAGKPSKSPL